MSRKFALGGITLVTVICVCVLFGVFGISSGSYDVSTNDMVMSYRDGNALAIKQTVMQRQEQTANNVGDAIAGNVPGVSIGGSSLNVDTSAFYTPQTVPAGHASTMAGNIPIHDGWPWGDTSNVTFVNVDGLFEDLINNVASISGSDKNSIRIINQWTVNTDKYCAETLLNIDSVQCLPICFYPAWVDPTYYSRQMSGENPVWSEAMAASKKACILLKDDNGKAFYVPITQSDNKGHTFPGGIAQTFMRETSTNGDGTVNVQCANTIRGPSGVLGTGGGGPYKYSSYVNGIGVGDGDIWTSTPSSFLQLFDNNSGYSLYYCGGFVLYT